MQRERQQWNYELLQKENEELKSDIDEQEKYIEELQAALMEERGKKASIKNNWGEVVSIALEGMVRRNTHLLGNIPMIGEGLAGAVDLDNQRRESATLNGPQAIQDRSASFEKIKDVEGGASFSKKQPRSQGDEETLEYFANLRKVFSGVEVSKILEIIGFMMNDKESIDAVLELLKEDTEENEDVKTN